MDPSVCDADLNIPGYILTRQDRGPQKKGGGLIVYAKTSSKFVRLILGLLWSVHGSANSIFHFSTIIEKSYFVSVKGLLFIGELVI